MKCIVYTRTDGGLAIIRPVEGARLAKSLTLTDGRRFDLDPIGPVDMPMKTWPVAGATAEWAETEDEFLARIARKAVPPDATDIYQIDPSELPTDRKTRDKWRWDKDAQKVVV